MPKKKMNTTEQSILQGLQEAVAFANGKKAGKSHRIKVRDVNVSALRQKLGLSQDRFAAAFGVSSSTVRNWEQGRRRPEGPARVLLHVIEKNPKAVLDALQT